MSNFITKRFISFSQMQGQLFLIAMTLTFWSQQVSQAADTNDTHHVTFWSFPFRVSYRPVDLKKGVTKNVSLRCAMIPNSDHPFLFLDSIILSRVDTQGGFVDVAKIEYLSGVTKYESGITAHGEIDDVHNAYLEIEWPLAVEETFGEYSCVVHGNDENFNILEEMSEVVIKPHDCKDML